MNLKRKYKIATLIFFTGIFLMSFNQVKQELVGTWKLKGDFYNLSLLEFHEDYYQVKGNIQYPISKVYKVRGDTLILEVDGEIKKIRFEVNEQELKFFDFKTDSLVEQYEKYNFPNHLNYLNKKLKTNINVPIVNSENVLTYLKQNVIMVEYNQMNNLEILINGRKHILNDTSYLLLKAKTEKEYSEKNNFMFLDKNIKLFDYNSILKELQKAEIYNVTNIAINQNGKLCCVEQNLKQYTENNYIKSPSPLTIKPKYSKNDCILFGRYLEKVETNGKVSNFDELKTQLRNKINTGDFKLLFIYFDDKINYGMYLNDLVEIRNIYYSIRNEYSEKEFKTNDIKNLQPEEINLIAKKIPMNFYFINNVEEYEKIKKNAL